MFNLLPANIISDFFFEKFLFELVKLLQIIKLFSNNKQKAKKLIKKKSRKLRENTLTLAAPKLAPEPVAAPGEKRNETFTI